MYKRWTKNRILITFKLIGYKSRRETFESKYKTTPNYSRTTQFHWPTKWPFFLNKMKKNKLGLH